MEPEEQQKCSSFIEIHAALSPRGKKILFSESWNIFWWKSDTCRKSYCAPRHFQLPGECCTSAENDVSRLSPVWPQTWVRADMRVCSVWHGYCIKKKNAPTAHDSFRHDVRHEHALHNSASCVLQCVKPVSAEEVGKNSCRNQRDALVIWYLFCFCNRFSKQRQIWWKAPPGELPLHKLLLKQIKTCVEFRGSAWVIMLEVVFVWEQRESIYLSVVSVVRQIWSAQRGWETCGGKWWDGQNKCIRPAVFLAAPLWIIYPGWRMFGRFGSPPSQL